MCKNLKTARWIVYNILIVRTIFENFKICSRFDLSRPDAGIRVLPTYDSDIKWVHPSSLKI